MEENVEMTFDLEKIQSTEEEAKVVPTPARKEVTVEHVKAPVAFVEEEESRPAQDVDALIAKEDRTNDIGNGN